MTALSLLAPLAALASAPFGPPVNVSLSAGTSLSPAIAVERSGPTAGDLRVFWHDFTAGSPYLGWAEAGAAGFGPPEVCPVNVDASRTARAATDSLGRTHLVWRNTDGAGEEEILYALLEAGAFTAPVNLSASPGRSRDPVLAVDVLDRPHVLWSDDASGAVRFHEAHFDGTAWSPAADTGLPFLAGAFQDKLRIAADATGQLHAVWDDGPDTVTEIYHAERPAAGGWGAPENLSLSPGETSADPAIAVGPGDVLHVVWVEQEASMGLSFEVVYSARLPASAWNAPVIVSAQGGNCIRPVLAAGADGEARIAWTLEGAGDREIWFVRRPGAPPTNVSDSPASFSERVALDLDAGGEAAVAWEEVVGGNREVLAATTRPSAPIRLMMTADRAAGDAVLEWSGGLPPYRVERSAGSPTTRPVEITPPGGIGERVWTDSGALAPSPDYYYQAR